VTVRATAAAKIAARRERKSATRDTQTGREAIRAGRKGAAVPKGRQAWMVECAGPGLATEKRRSIRSSILIRVVRERNRAPSFPGRYRKRSTFAHSTKGWTHPRYESSPRHVVEARYLGDYKVWLEFNDGRKGVVDLSDDLHGDQRAPLRNRETFSTFYLDYGLASIAWLDGIDFTPEFLYERLKEMH